MLLAVQLYKIDCDIIIDHNDPQNTCNTQPRYRLSLNNYFLIERNVDWDIDNQGCTEISVVELVQGPQFLKLENLNQDFKLKFKSLRLNNVEIDYKQTGQDVFRFDIE